MDLQLGGDVAVVVGGARGLGRAIAEGFAAEGARVVLVDRDPAVEAAAGEVGGRAFVADVTDPEAVRAVAAGVREQLGACDHVVHAAAVGSGKVGFPFWRLDPEDWGPVLRVNLAGAANVAHAFAPAMAEARRGTILFLASVAGQVGSSTDPPYSASKAGVIALARCAARDLAPFGVRVNALCPGMVRTDLVRSIHAASVAGLPEADRPDFEAWAAEKLARLVPLGRWQDPEDVAAMAVFLASPRAKNVTGQTINVDGGYVMH